MRSVLLNLLIALTFGCAPVLRGPLDSANPEPAKATLDHGYALLYQVLHDESSVTLLFGVKHASEPIETLVRRIGDAAANGEAAIRSMAESPPPIDWKKNGLPLIEVSARNHIVNEQVAAFLFAGDSFEVQLLLTQQKACSYISALAVSLAAADINASRSAMLTTLARQFAGFDADLRDHLRVNQPSSSNRGS
ncbi:MAG: hypothetical protein QGI75_05075 [Phycisphaerales bacterium]|jgi:hypothetical protein|nr:hypothetical protein [Phycisphaerales bacterium]MDP6889698.1 hypothetical protein [Phycisphaerales bacterium]